MTPMTIDSSDKRKPVIYAERRRQQRMTTATRLSERVKRPVIEQTAPPPEKGIPAWLGGSGFFIAALVLHGVITGVLLAFEGNGETVQRTDKVVFQVVEPEPRIPEAIEPEPEPEPEQEESIDVAAPDPEPQAIPEKQIKTRRVRMAKADPVNRREPEVKPEPARRAVVGIEMSSTVKGGAGPSYAVGNTRMGATAASQSFEKIEKLTKGTQSGKGGGDVAATSNRTATFIPTVSSNFTRPKRLQSVDLPYPPSLKSKGIEGNVVVLIVIDEQGTVQKVRILKSSGYREFDEAAMKAAQKELYSPAQRDGQAVEYNLKYTYRFRMKGA
jgi:periplasmic protein TonB